MKFTPVNRKVRVSSKEVYDLYSASTKMKPLSKKQLGTLVMRLYPTIKVIKNREGCHEYEGLNHNTMNDRICTLNELDVIAGEFQYMKMPTIADCYKYGIMTDHYVNKIQIMKIVEIKPDRTFTVYVGGRGIRLSDIGLNNIVANTYLRVRVIFNTVKQARLCKGKPVENKMNARKSSNIQEWTNEADENSMQLTQTSRNCHGVVNFFATSEMCNTCSHQKRITSNIDDNASFEDMLKTHFEGANDVMLAMLKQQRQMCLNTRNPRTRRWDKEILQISLSLWNRSPEGYSTLRNSSMVYLPSESLLKSYKNCIQQKPGINDDMFKWLYTELNRLKCEKNGGLIIDEMSVQEDLQLGFRDNKVKIDGLVDMGQFSDDMKILNTHARELKTASHVLQFIFLGYDGFRFPVAYFPTLGATAPEMYMNVWDVVSKLYEFDINVDYICFDGSSNNRTLQLMHFKDISDAREKKYTTINPIVPDRSVTIIMDYSHNIKKIRNNIYASGDAEFCKRKLKFSGRDIVWYHWIQAYNWDKEKNNLRIHQRLTNEHIFLNKQAKMRNHLAEETLDKDMLHLMQQFKGSVKDGTYLEGTLELLVNTSKMIEIFRDPRPIIDLYDKRLETLKSIEKWFDDWNSEVNNLDVSSAEKNKTFLSKQTYQDTISLLTGFVHLCGQRTMQNHSITPAGINSDIVENFFCQQRSTYHGSNTNPSVHQYQSGINSTVLGQTAVSKKSNAKPDKRKSLPLSLSTHGPLKKRKSSK